MKMLGTQEFVRTPIIGINNRAKKRILFAINRDFLEKMRYNFATLVKLFEVSKGIQFDTSRPR